jgi:serine/threonine-protein kinase
MVFNSSSSLVEAVRATELLDAEHLARLEGDLQGRFPAAVDLGRQLLQLGWLTAYQVNQLLQGQGALLQLGPYLLLERLGAGGMGQVFKAHHRRLLRVVALKVIRKERLAQANVVQRFLREARAAAQVSHPNVVAVHDADRAGDAYYLAMELLDGIDLGRLVAQAGPLPVARACDYACQAAQGLQHAHQAGLVHRDVKPQNLFVALSSRGKPRPPGPARLEDFAGGTVKVLDLGLVLLQESSADSLAGALTQNGMVIGTVDYLAPEQAKNAHEAGPQADLYSLGCTLYYLLAGQPPFTGGQPLDRLLRHQFEAPPPITGKRPDVPPAVVSILDRLLAKRPEDRFASARELAEALAATLPGCPAQPAPAAVSTAQAVPLAQPLSEGLSGIGPARVLGAGAGNRRPPRRGTGRRRWWVGAGAALAGLIVTVAILGLRRPEASPSNTPLSRSPPSKSAPPRRAPGPGEPLAEYLPADCAGAIGVNFQQLRTGRLLGKRPGGLPLGSEARAGLRLLGMPPNDLSTVRVLLRTKQAAGPLFVVRGKIVLERFQRLGKALQEVPAGPGHPYFLFKYWDRTRGKTTWIGTRAPHYLLASEDRSAVVAALAHAEQPAPEDEAPVRPLLAGYRKQAVWVALDLEKLGPLALPAPLEKLGGAILRDTARLHGGVTDGKQPRARFVFEAREGRAAVVEKGLRALVAGGAPWLDAEERAVLRMFSKAVITRRGQSVMVECPLSPAPWK